MPQPQLYPSWLCELGKASQNPTASFRSKHWVQYKLVGSSDFLHCKFQAKDDKAKVGKSTVSHSSSNKQRSQETCARENGPRILSF